MQRVLEQRLEAGADILNGNATRPARRAVDAHHNRMPHRLGEPFGVRVGPGHRPNQQLSGRLWQFRRHDGQAICDLAIIDRHDGEPGGHYMRAGG